jgi:hypothetical protein
MADELLALAWEAAEKSKPAVRAAALLRISRVETTFDRVQARKTFAQALDGIRRLPGRDGQFLLEHARLFAAAVAPDILRQIPPLRHMPREVESERLGRIMLEHGNSDAAFEYVMGYDDTSTFPFPVASALIELVGDDERRLTVFRRAIQAWRAAHGDRFIWLFQSQWKLLPTEEARDVAREIVRVALEQPDQPTHSTYSLNGTVQFTSSRENTLFRILHVLRHLDGPLAESLIASHEQFAAASRRFPNGMESLMQEAAARRKADGESCSGSYVMTGNPGDFPYMKAFMQASQDADFGSLIEHAIESYREDTAPENPNQTPQEFWPSTHRFRSILYKAGKRVGAEAAVYLDRVPDPDLRLLAQIELAAALAGLPELQGSQRGFRPHRSFEGRHLQPGGTSR